MNTTYARTRGGAMVHLANCRYAKTGAPWNWAEGKPLDELVFATQGLGISWCLVCWPMSKGVAA